MPKFNLKLYKEARRGSEPPQVFQPRMWNDDEYFRNPSPGSGRGHKMTTPGSQGLPGEPSDLSSPEVSRIFPDGGPHIPSSDNSKWNEDDFVAKNAPADSDPDHPYYENVLTDGQYNDGTNSDHGQTLHDDAQPSFDSAIGTYSTVARDMSHNLDRNTPYADMSRSRIFNVRQNRSDDIFDLIRQNNNK